MNSDRFDPENALTRDGGGRAEVVSATTDPEREPVGAVAEQHLDDLAARQRAALNRLARAHRRNR